MSKEEAKEALKVYPDYPDIKEYAYVMMWDKGRNKWIAGYEGENSHAWYVCDGNAPKIITSLGSPWIGETVYYEKVVSIANE